MRAQGLTDKEAQALGNLGLKGEVQIWMAADLIGEDQVVQTLEAQASGRKVQIQKLQEIEEMTGEALTLEGQNLFEKDHK